MRVNAMRRVEVVCSFKVRFVHAPAYRHRNAIFRNVWVLLPNPMLLVLEPIAQHRALVNLEIGPPGRTALFLAVVVYNTVKGHAPVLLENLPALEMPWNLKSVIFSFAQWLVLALNGDLLLSHPVVPPEALENVVR